METTDPIRHLTDDSKPAEQRPAPVEDDDFDTLDFDPDEADITARWDALGEQFVVKVRIRGLDLVTVRMDEDAFTQSPPGTFFVADEATKRRVLATCSKLIRDLKDTPISLDGRRSSWKTVTLAFPPATLVETRISYDRVKFSNSPNKYQIPDRLRSSTWWFLETAQTEIPADLFKFFADIQNSIAETVTARLTSQAIESKEKRATSPTGRNKPEEFAWTYGAGGVRVLDSSYPALPQREPRDPETGEVLDPAKYDYAEIELRLLAEAERFERDQMTRVLDQADRVLAEQKAKSNAESERGFGGDQPGTVVDSIDALDPQTRVITDSLGIYKVASTTAVFQRMLREIGALPLMPDPGALTEYWARRALSMINRNTTARSAMDYWIKRLEIFEPDPIRQVRLLALVGVIGTSGDNSVVIGPNGRRLYFGSASLWEAPLDE